MEELYKEIKPDANGDVYYMGYKLQMPPLPMVRHAEVNRRLRGDFEEEAEARGRREPSPPVGPDDTDDGPDLRASSSGVSTGKERGIGKK